MAECEMTLIHSSLRRVLLLRDRTINTAHVLKWLAQIQPIFVKTPKYTLMFDEKQKPMALIVWRNYSTHKQRYLKCIITGPLKDCVFEVLLCYLFNQRAEHTSSLHRQFRQPGFHDYTRCLHSTEYLWSTWKYNQSWIKGFFEKKTLEYFFI